MSVQLLERPKTLREVAERTALIRAEITKRQKFNDIPSAFLPLEQPARYLGAHGGRGSGKSWYFARKLIKRCAQKQTRWVCIREHQVSLEESVKRLLEDTINDLWLPGFTVRTNHIETPFDGIIIFKGMKDQTAESIKSLEGYDGAWVEEAQSFSEISLRLLRPTIRKKGSEIWFSWNPEQPNDPIDVLLRGPNTPPGAVVVKTTYLDNPHFPDVLKREMEWDKGRDLETYEHVWGGAYTKHAEARVFKNWRVEDFVTPDDVTLYFGADWGFSIDPSTLVRCWLRDRTLFIDHEAYAVGVEIDDLPALFDTVPGGREWVIKADSARPETISYMQRHDYPKMISARKGPDSVKEGIIFLQSYDIVIHSRCVRTKQEFERYSYKKGAVDPTTGKSEILPILQDKENHIIDPLRYALEDVQRDAVDGSLTW